MSENSKIEWTDHTLNPWWGCTAVAEGCKHCYAKRYAGRFKPEVKWGNPYTYWHRDRKHIESDLSRWNRKAKKAGEVHRVMIGSMCDIFEDPFDKMAQWLFLDAPLLYPWLAFLFITKRPENAVYLCGFAGANPATDTGRVFVLASASTKGEAKMAVEELLRIKRVLPVRIGLSLEPWLDTFCLNFDHEVGWVIMGGENGPGARAIPLDAPRWARYECEKVGIPFFFKGWGDARDSNPSDSPCIGDHKEIPEFPKP